MDLDFSAVARVGIAVTPPGPRLVTLLLVLVPDLLTIPDFLRLSEQ
jgi:hypothetical protein